MVDEFNVEEIKLQKSFKRLIDFAERNGFSQSWNKIYVVESESIRKYFSIEKKNEISRSSLIEFSDYEKHFDEKLLRQGYSWINLSLLGVSTGDLILTIEFPSYKNTLAFTSVNLSCSDSEILNRDLSVKYEIID